MDSNRDIRKKARQRLENHWGGCVLISLLSLVLGGVNALLFMTELPVMLLLEHSAGQLRLAFALTVHIIIGLFIGGMTELGHDRCFLMLRAGGEPETRDVFSLRLIWFKSFLLRLLICGETVLRTILLIVPGVVALFQYALAPWLMAQNPNLEVPDAVKTSSILMKGYKAKLWRLVWSFFFWFLLSVASFGLGFIFLIPYFKAAMAEFYGQRIAEHDADVRAAGKNSSK